MKLKQLLFASCLSLLLIGFSQSASAQADTPTPKKDHSYKPLTVRLNDDGSKYIRFITWHQLWLQTGDGQSGLAMSIRRSRFLAYAQISPRFLILTHWGLNNLTTQGITANPNTQSDNQASLLFLHDAWAEFAVVPEKFHVGTGLHYWNGISRLTNQSTLNMMTLDNPGRVGLGGEGPPRLSDAALFPWSNITSSDQFARHLGVYAKGTIGKFGYRIAANGARRNVGSLSTEELSFQVDGDGQDWLVGGYFKYDVFDKESDKLPYFVGTYFGAKKVLSIGAGFHHHPNALARGVMDEEGTMVIDEDSRENITKWAVDVFYDAPVGDNGGAINALGAYYNYDFGGSETFSGGGLVPGSGNIIYGQLGYVLPFKAAETRFMPYVAYSQQNFDATPDSSYELNVGLNWLINGHFAKVTVEYATGQQGFEGAETNNRFTIQTHIFL